MLDHYFWSLLSKIHKPLFAYLATPFCIGGTAEYRISLPLQRLETADTEAKPVLEKALHQVGFLPNMYAGMVNSPGLLDTYLAGYAAFRKRSGFTTQEQEVILLTVSRENGCTYCMAAHSAIADNVSKVPVEVTDAIRAWAPEAKHRVAAE